MKIRRIGVSSVLLIIAVSILVYLNSSELEAKVKMPGLIDVPVDMAIRSLKSCDLDTGKIIYGYSAPDNVVLEQRYKGKKILPGTLVHKGEKIDLVVPFNFYKINMVLPMPNLLLMPLDEAEELLKGYELIIEKTIYVDNNTHKPGTVVRQQPSKTTKVNSGDTVQLWVVRKFKKKE